MVSELLTLAARHGLKSADVGQGRVGVEEEDGGREVTGDGYLVFAVRRAARAIVAGLRGLVNDFEFRFLSRHKFNT